jgi:hypothetical protein
MKKIAYVMFGLMTAGLMFLSSCSSDETTPGDIHPALNFVGGSGYISGDAILDASTTFTVGLNAFSSTESNAKLTNFKVTRVYKNKPSVVLDSTINVSQFSIDLDYTTVPEAGVENFIFTITDKDGVSKELSFNITTVVTTGPGPINTFSMKIMGAQGSTTGSSFASIDGTVYDLADAKINAAKIDWLYFYGATNFATIAAPDDPDAKDVFNNATNGLQTWSVLNPTRFKKIATAVDWNSITNDSLIVILTESGVDLTKANNLDITDVVGFVSATGKKGLIRVEEITGTNAGTMTISVKVQQ